MSFVILAVVVTVVALLIYWGRSPTTIACVESADCPERSVCYENLCIFGDCIDASDCSSSGSGGGACYTCEKYACNPICDGGDSSGADGASSRCLVDESGAFLACGTCIDSSDCSSGNTCSADYKCVPDG